MFGSVGKPQCFLSDVGSYRKPKEKVKQWDGVGELREFESKS